MEALIKEKQARTPAQKKISSALLYAKTNKFAPALASNKDAGKQFKSLNQVDAQGRVLVDIKADMGKLGGKIESLGGTVTDSHLRSARAWVALDQLETLASESAVKSIKPAYLATTSRVDKPGTAQKLKAGTRDERIAAVQAAEAVWAQSHAQPVVNVSSAPVAANDIPQGAAISEGDRAHGANRARRMFGVDGTGVKVGVLSDSDDFKEQAIASGDLPANTITLDGQSGRPGAGEGTAMMEIVHDLAPGAQLFFATAFTSPESFADNIRALRFQAHCDVIIDDVIYFAESPYQDDIIAQAVNDVVADGAMYFSSAGNGGNFDDGTSGTWEGDFQPAGTLATLPSGYTVHSFGNGIISDRVELDGGPLQLQWADPGTIDVGGSGNDYDLFVLDNDLRTIAVASTDIQDGDDEPIEFLGFIIPAGFRVVIAAAPNAQARALRTVIFNGELGLSTAGNTFGHNSAAGAFGVAAVDSFEANGPNGEFTGGPTTPTELFSSDGARRIFYDPSGKPINPTFPGGTFASKGGVTRVKPDLSAADGVSTTLPAGSGLNPFFGTSAAAPHAGAIAALLKSAVPTATPAQIRTALTSTALDIEAPGTDRNAGAGIAMAIPALTRIGAKLAVHLVESNVDVRPLGADVVLPGGAAQVNVTITDDGGAAANATTATLTSTSPDVIILQGTSSYGTIAPGASATNAIPYAFFLNPTAPCGEVLHFDLTVNYTGNGVHPIVLGFDVQTGRAGGATTHVAYTGPVVAIPDGNPAGVDIPFAVTGTGSIASLKFNIDGSACSATQGSTTVGVDHSWVGDLTFTLTSPSGRTATLINAAGGTGNSGNNFCQTVLDPAAANSIQAVTIDQAPFTGTFSPLQSTSVFSGDNPAGTWHLHVTDNAFIDTGSVRAFSIDYSGFTCTR
ncbi:MAG TPA: S8 family serine peptidase [Kofleriaceae bacterium]|nr:S8 family serine peptidase [Kofleriaceae bacterium]